MALELGHRVYLFRREEESGASHMLVGPVEGASAYVEFGPDGGLSAFIPRLQIQAVVWA